MLAHQPGHGVLAAGDAPGLQLAVDPRRAVDRAGLRVGLADLLDEPTAADGRRARRSVPPGVVAAPRDPQDLAQQLDGEVALVVADEGELHGCSLAKKAVAFFKISRSIRSRLFSARSRSFSRRELALGRGGRGRRRCELAGPRG